MSLPPASAPLSVASAAPDLPRRSVLVLGTGGTIAGHAANARDNVGYVAGQVAVAELVSAAPGLADVPLQVEQVAQLDSKDMDHAVWRQLVLRVARALEDPDVRAIVVIHGTDTLEETAYFLHAVLAPIKPVVLTAAMRPASSSQADGPRNLADAVAVACTLGAQGVLVVVAGAIWRGDEVRKIHNYRLDPFGAGDAGPLGWIEEGRLRQLREWPSGQALGTAQLSELPWPDVQIVLSHAGASGLWVDRMVAVGVDGLVAAGTGNGTLHQHLEAALLRAQAAGVAVLRCSRVGAGALIDTGASALPSAGALTPVQARIALMLQLLGRRQRA